MTRRLLILLLFASPCLAQTNTFCASNLSCNVAAPWNFTTFENVQFIDAANTQARTGTDFGGWFNSAYTAGFAGAAAINAFSSTTNRINFSTPMAATVSGQTLNLNCPHPSNGQGTAGFSLNYTPVTATTMFTLDYTPTSSVTWTPSEIKGCTFVNNQNFVQGGNGSSATGIALGTTNGGAGWLNYSNDAVIGFGTGVLLDNAVGGWGEAFDNSTIGDNTTGINMTAAQEVVHLTKSRLMSNGTGFKQTGAGDVVFVQAQCDSNTILCFDGSGISGGGTFTSLGSHYENFNTTNCQYVSTVGNLNLFGGDILNDSAAGGTCTRQFALTGASAYNVTGVTVGTKGQVPSTNVFLVNSPAVGFFQINNTTPAFYTSDSLVMGGNSLSYIYMPCTVQNGGTNGFCHSYFFNNSASAAATNSAVFGRSVTPSATGGGVAQVMIHYDSSNEQGFVLDNCSSSCSVDQQAFSIGPGVGGGTANSLNFFDYTNAKLRGYFAPSGSAANAGGEVCLPGGTSGTGCLIAPATAGVTNTLPTITGPLGATGNTTNGFYQSKRGVAGCTTAASIGGTCASDITVTWTTAFADANYSVTCTGSTPTAVPAAPFVVSGTKLAATVHINYFAITAVAASYATIDCTAVHD